MNPIGVHRQRSQTCVEVEEIERAIVPSWLTLSMRNLVAMLGLLNVSLKISSVLFSHGNFAYICNYFN